MEEKLLLFDQTIKKIEPLFKLSGVNIKSGEQTKHAFKSRFIYFFNFFWLLIDSCGGMFWFIDGVKTGKDFFSLTDVAPCNCLSTLATFKGIFQFTAEKHVHILIDNLRQLELQGKDRIKSDKKNIIQKQQKKFLETIIDKLNVLFAMVVISFSLTPLVMMAVKYYQTKEIEFILPILILYPFNPFQMKVFPFVFLHQVWSECVTTLNICTADYFFFTCCTYISIQFRLLQHDMENIIPDDVNNVKVIEDEEFKEKLRNLVLWHQKLIESANVLEIISSKSLLLNFISSSLIICLAGFNVTMMSTDVTAMMKFLSFLFLGLMQVFCLCFFADLLTNSSIGVGQAVYNSRWHMAEPRIAKKLLLILTRAQRPCKVTACGFADVNLNSFMRVLSSSYSYFALLQTMYAN